MSAFPGRRGSLFIVTLWMIAILAVLAVAVGRYLSIEVRLTRYHLAHEQAKALARDGVWLAQTRLRQDAGDPLIIDWLGELWAMPAANTPAADQAVWVIPWRASGRSSDEPDGQVEIRMIDEERKLNLNAQAVTASELQRLGVPLNLAEGLIEYRNGPGRPPSDDPPFYAPKARPFCAVEEAWELPGMTAETMDLLQRATYPFPPASTPTVNINTADRAVLIAAGLLPEHADAVETFRRDGHRFTSLSPSIDSDAPFSLREDAGFLTAVQRMGVTSQVFAVTATGVLLHPRTQYRIEAVIQRTPEFKVLAWREFS